MHFGLQNANMSAQKKSSGGAGRTKVLPAGVDGVAVPSIDESGGEDFEVCSVFDVLKLINNLSSLNKGKHLEFHQKYSAMHRIFNSLLIWKHCQTLSFVLYILYTIAI